MPSQESQPLLLLSPGDVSLFLSPKTEELCLWGHFPKGLAGKGKPILSVNAIFHALGSLTVKGRLFCLLTVDTMLPQALATAPAAAPAAMPASP